MSEMSPLSPASVPSWVVLVCGRQEASPAVVQAREVASSACSSERVVELTVSVRVAVPVPAWLVALRVMEETPDETGVPEISPVDVDTERPAGRPLAAKPVGLLPAVIW